MTVRVYRIDSSPWGEATEEDLLACHEHAWGEGGMKDVDIAATWRDHQPRAKAVFDFEYGKVGEFAAWHLLPEGTPAPDLYVEHRRDRCHFGADVGEYSVKTLSRFGWDSWVYQLRDLDGMRYDGRRERPRWEWAILLDPATRHRFTIEPRHRPAYLLNHEAARTLAAPMKIPSLIFKRALYRVDLDAIAVPLLWDEFTTRATERLHRHT